MNFKLKTSKQIGKMITDTVKAGKSFTEMFHTTAVQCLAHAEKHGDVTLMQRLVQETANECKGVAVNGLVQWVRENSPIAIGFKADENGKAVRDEAGNLVVEAKKLKEGDEGYKPFTLEEAEKKPALDDPRVTRNNTRDLRPMSVAEFKRLVKGMAKRVVEGQGYKFGGEQATPEEQEVEKRRVEAYANRVTLMLDNISIEVPKADTKEAVTGEPDRISRKGRKAQGQSKAAA